MESLRMARWVLVRNPSRGDTTIIRARWCESYLCRLRGLTFRRSLPPGEGLLLVDARESISGTSIHMWGVFFPIGVIWLDSAKWVVDCKVAHPWRIYTPASPARYVLEGPLAILEHVKVGDALEMVDENLD
jgi:uncharacterized membrane protein (UPF0127 family)